MCTTYCGFLHVWPADRPTDRPTIIGVLLALKSMEDQVLQLSPGFVMHKGILIAIVRLRHKKL